MNRRLVHYYASPDASSSVGSDLSRSENAGDFRETTAQRRDHQELRELERALICCHLHEASLRVVCPVEWLDDARFLKRFRGAGVPVAILDSPVLADNALDSLIWAAERRHEHISERTRAGLRLAKRNGVKLGNARNLSNRAEGSRRGVKRRKQNADERAARAGPLIETLRSQGCTYRTIAHELQRQSVPTERGGAWTATQVTRVLARMRSLRSQPPQALLP